MDKKDEILGTVLIGILLARFLLNTSRVLQAIKLFQECLILLNNLAQGGVGQLFYTGLYFQMIEAYYLLNDHTSGIECAKKTSGDCSPPQLKKQRMHRNLSPGKHISTSK